MRNAAVMVLSKWTALALTCLIGFGAYYSFDTPSVLHNQMFRHYKTHHGDKLLFEFYFSLIYSLYSLPNMGMPLLGGIMVDLFGNKLVMLAFACLVLLGNIIETIACFRQDLIIFLIGRFVFGLGAESLQVCGSIVISRWFKGQELAFAMGVNLSISKLASVLTDWISPTMEQRFGIEFNSCFVLFLCSSCFVFTLALIAWDTDEVDFKLKLIDNLKEDAVYDYDTEAQLCDSSHLLLQPSKLLCYGSKNGSFISETLSLLDHDLPTIPEYSSNNSSKKEQYSSSSELSRSTDSETKGDINELLQDNCDLENRSNSLSTLDFPISTDSCSVRSNSGGSIIDSYDLKSIVNNNAKDTTIVDKLVQADTLTALLESSSSLSDACEKDNRNRETSQHQEQNSFTISVWLLLLVAFLMYGTFMPFTNWSNMIILQLYFSKPTSAIDASQHEIFAAWLQSIPNLLSVFLTPIVGISVDWFGHRTAQLTGAALLLFIAHNLIYTQLIGPVLPLLLIGLAYSIFGSVVWPCVPVIVPVKLQGTAYGLMCAFQNTGQFVAPLILQHIYLLYHNYLPCEEQFIRSSALAAMAAMLLWIADERWGGGALRLPSDESSSNNSENNITMITTKEETQLANIGNDIRKQQQKEEEEINKSLNEKNHSNTTMTSVCAANDTVGMMYMNSSNLSRIIGSSSYHTNDNDKIRHHNVDTSLSRLELGSSRYRPMCSNSVPSASSSPPSSVPHINNYNSYRNYDSNNKLSHETSCISGSSSSSSHSPSSQILCNGRKSSDVSINKQLNNCATNVDIELSPSAMHCKKNDNSVITTPTKVNTNGRLSLTIPNQHHKAFASSVGALLDGMNRVTSSSSEGTDGQSPPPKPIAIIPIPNIVHHSQAYYYQRANSFQFPIDDPLQLRKQITERSRLLPPEAVAQSAPANSPARMELYKLQHKEHAGQEKKAGIASTTPTSSSSSDQQPNLQRAYSMLRFRM